MTFKSSGFDVTPQHDHMLGYSRSVMSSITWLALWKWCVRNMHVQSKSSPENHKQTAMVVRTVAQLALFSCTRHFFFIVYNVLLHDCWFASRHMAAKTGASNIREICSYCLCFIIIAIWCYRGFYYLRRMMKLHHIIIIWWNESTWL